MAEPMALSTPANEKLTAAERDLYEWATGQQSSIGEQMGAEPLNADGDPRRGETLVLIAQQDAAEIECRISRVRALRLLSGLSLDGTVPS
jgi:hypothetical protein